MITIPLATVVCYLTRKGVNLGCLEGAPIVYIAPGCPVGRLRAIDQEEIDNPASHPYLGTNAVCPAAMGWVTRLLSVAREPASNAVWVGDKLLELWTVGCVESNHRWVWHSVIPAAEEWPEATYLPGIAPATPAARLRAVRDYEMGRDE